MKKFMRLRAPNVIMEIEKVWTLEVIWEEEAKCYVTRARGLAHVEAATLFSMGPVNEGATELVDWLNTSGKILQEQFSYHVSFEFGFGQAWSLRDEEPPICLERGKADAGVSVLVDSARELDQAGFGWQKKERLYAAILFRAHSLGMAGPVKESPSMASIRQVIEAGRARDKGTA